MPQFALVALSSGVLSFVSPLYFPYSIECENLSVLTPKKCSIHRSFTALRYNLEIKLTVD